MILFVYINGGRKTAGRKDGMTMKKLIAMILALVLAGGMAACAAAETNMVDGWSVAEDTAITEENRAIFDKGMEKLVGVQYEPVAYLGSQLVAGMNHCFLCKATVVYPNAVPTWKLVYLYENLQGEVSVLNIADLEIDALAVQGDHTEE